MSDKFRKKREKMIERQLIKRGIEDEEILEAFRSVPRHEFVPRERKKQAYQDRPLPIGENQTISQPYIVAYLMDKLQPSENDRVLEVGSGCGYVLALLSHIVGEVYGVERRSSLVKMSRKILARLDYDIEVKHGDGSKGWPRHAPFDGIMVSAAAASIPDDLRNQLAIPGRMILPVGEKMFFQQLVLVTRRREDKFGERKLEPVRFVPLVEGRE